MGGNLFFAVHVFLKKSFNMAKYTASIFRRSSVICFLTLPVLLMCTGPVFGQKPNPDPRGWLKHPGYDWYNVRPTDWPIEYGTQYPLSGVDFLDDGRMVVCNYRGQQSKENSVFLIDGVLTATDQTGVSWEEIHTGLYCPLGVRVVDGEIFITEKDRLSKLTPNASSWDFSVVYQGHDPHLKPDGTYEYFYHWFTHGLVYKDAKFYWVTSGFYQYEELNDVFPEKHGVLVEYDPGTNSHRNICSGFRNPGGLGTGPLNEIFIMESQGDWMPTCKLIRPVEGAWYGFGGPDYYWGQQAGGVETGPAIWLTYETMANSTNEPLYLPKGIYQGQMIAGDNYVGFGGRYFVEKVNNIWQGCCFFWSGGFDSGIERNILGPDSLTIFAVGLGDGNNGYWHWQGDMLSGVHRLVPNNTPVFEMLRIRSLNETQFEITFTLPANAAAGDAANYQVDTWVNNPSSGYGAGHRDQREDGIPVEVELSADGKTAVLTLNASYITPHQLGRQISFQLDQSAIMSQNGDTLYTNVGDYTIHNAGPAEWPVFGCTDPSYGEFDPTAHLDDGSCLTLTGIKKEHLAAGEQLFTVKNTLEGLSITVPFAAPFQVSVVNLKGVRQLAFEGKSPQRFTILHSQLPKGIYVVSVTSGAHSFSKEVVLY
jgi:hypothetical protein